jgi:hypothetical protein
MQRSDLPVRDNGILGTHFIVAEDIETAESWRSPAVAQRAQSPACRPLRNRGTRRGPREASSCRSGRARAQARSRSSPLPCPRPAHTRATDHRTCQRRNLTPRAQRRPRRNPRAPPKGSRLARDHNGAAPVTRDIADQIDYSTGAVHRTLEDLAALAFAQRESDPGDSHRWQLRDWVRERLR